MKIKYIKPFIDAVYELFTMMLECKIHKGELSLRKSENASHEITSLIGLSGTARGSVALSFPAKTAISIANRLLGSEVTELDRTVSDAVSEMANIVAGSAKSKFFIGDGRPIDLSLPNVIIGKKYVISYPSMTTWLEVPFTSDLGPFSMRVTFEMGNLDGK